MRSGATGLVVTWTPCRLNAGSARASTAATSTGMYSGRQPAITALMAIFSVVAAPLQKNSTATTSGPARPVAASQHGDHVGACAAGGRDHGLHPLDGGRHDGQPVRPVMRLVELEDVLEPVRDLDVLGRYRHHVPLVSALNASFTRRSASARRSSAPMVTRSWAMVRRTRSGSPPDLASRAATGAKDRVHSSTAGTFRRSSSIESWTLHDVHDPQQARPTRATSAASAISSRTAASAGRPYWGLRYSRTSRPPRFLSASRRSGAMAS